MSEKIKPFINIGPGQIIKRNLEALNWTQEDLAEVIGMSEKSVSLLLNNKQSITVETAILLSKAFESSPEFWLNLEQNYRLRERVEQEKEKEAEIKAEIRRHMPLTEMRKKGWVDYDASLESQIKAFNGFWKVKEPEFSMYKDEALSYCARQKKDDGIYTKYYTATWLQKAKLTADRIKSVDYSGSALTDLSVNIPAYSLRENGISDFITALNKCGVKFFVLSHLQKTYLDGACFIHNNNPVIIYTARYNRLDNFWFTMAHEMAHVLLHLKKENDCFLDNLDETGEGNRKEKEADKAAGTYLNTDALLKSAEPFSNYFSEEKLLYVSDKTGLNPSLALGILQHYDVISYRTLSKYRVTVKDLIPEKYIADKF